MSFAVLATLLGVGAVVGLASGLLGIGGGVLIVPFLYLFYARPDWSGASVPPSLQAVVAHATSLAVILPTAMHGTIDQHRAGRVLWRAALPIGIASSAGAVVGASVAARLPAPLLKLAFGVVLVGAAANLVRTSTAHARQHERVSALVTIPIGLAIGVFSAVLGVGGGIIAIPLLIYVVGLDVERVAATSLAIISLAAVAGVVTYMVRGAGVAGLPAFSVGYVHLFAALPILLGSLLLVRRGTALNRRLDARLLRVIFALLFVALGIRLIALNLGALR
ncbi:MAG: sulfite exporter TauE/SafE family protein [Longimicrobiales bacterium]